MAYGAERAAPGSLAAVIAAARRRRWAHLLVVNLRILLGFAFLPAGTKKVLGQPFTDADKQGPFHDFLDAFFATGIFYRLVGVLQLVAAVLLLTQLRATLGAWLALPVITAIVALCWSTGVIPTAVVATLMWCGALALVLWDVRAWRAVVGACDVPLPSPDPWLVDERLWAACGAAIVVVYAALTGLAGEVYRPRRIELDRPAFYVLAALPLLPIATWVAERRRRRAAARTPSPP